MECAHTATILLTYCGVDFGALSVSPRQFRRNTDASKKGMLAIEYVYYHVSASVDDSLKLSRSALGPQVAWSGRGVHRVDEFAHPRELN